LNPAPTGAEHLPPEIVDLSSRADDALYAAVIKGDAAEDDSQGYALTKNPAARALQMQERTWALVHGPELVSVVRDSEAGNQREIASELLGYQYAACGRALGSVFDCHRRLSAVGSRNVWSRLLKAICSELREKLLNAAGR
jgi:hypothetical protein